jgi:hypothetical protein
MDIYATRVANEKILIQAKEEYLDGLLDLNSYQKRLDSFGYRLNQGIRYN